FVEHLVEGLCPSSLIGAVVGVWAERRTQRLLCALVRRSLRQHEGMSNGVPERNSGGQEVDTCFAVADRVGKYRNLCQALRDILLIVEGPPNGQRLRQASGGVGVCAF